MAFAVDGVPGSETTPGPTLPALLKRTAAVIEGEVADISFEFDDWNGPVTVIALESVETHLGPFDSTSVQLRLAGGPLPNGRWMEVSELPVFRMATRYLVFLRRGPWHYDPRVESLMVAKVDGVDRLATEDGLLISKCNRARGFLPGRVSLFSREARTLGEFPPMRARKLVVEEQEQLLRSQSKAQMVATLSSVAREERVEFETFQEMPDASTPWNWTPTVADEGERDE